MGTYASNNEIIFVEIEEWSVREVEKELVCVEITHTRERVKPFKELGQEARFLDFGREFLVHEDLQESKVIQVSVLCISMERWTGFLESTRIKRHSIVFRPTQHIHVRITVIFFPGKRSKLALEQLPCLDLSKRVEKDDTKNDFVGFPGTFFNDLSDDVLTDTIKYAIRVAESVFAKCFVIGPARNANDYLVNSCIRIEEHTAEGARHGVYHRYPSFPLQTSTSCRMRP